jgi:hypothetical protein
MIRYQEIPVRQGGPMFYKILAYVLALIIFLPIYAVILALATIVSGMLILEPAAAWITVTVFCLVSYDICASRINLELNRRFSPTQ